MTMHMDPVMPYLVGSVAAVLLVGILTRAIRQPTVVGYLIAGVALGPHGLDFLSDATSVARLGEIGVVLLLFFVGMEISLPALIERWKVSLFGTCLQIGISVLVGVGVGAFLGWDSGRSIFVGLVISLSSTAVVTKILASRGETGSAVGQDVLSILLAQDIAIVPMLIVIGLLGGQQPEVAQVAAQVFGGVSIVGFLVFLARKQEIHLPFAKWLKSDKENQVFGALFLCFSMALLTGLLGLSAALGAFVAGIVVGAAKETEWVHEALYPLHVILLALFFVSVGMLIDIGFVEEHIGLLTLLLAAVFFVNSAVNSGLLMALDRPLKHSIYGGVMLSQIGEFSFVLAAVGAQAGIIGEFGHQLSIAVIALSLTLSSVVVSFTRRRLETSAS